MNDEGKRLVAGFHAVTARLRRGGVEVVYVDAQRRDGRMRQLLERVQAAGVELVMTDAQRLQRMAGEVPHQGVVASCAPTTELRLDDVLERVSASTLILLLDGVTDPRNLGACLRTADAAGADAVIVPRDRSAPMTAVVAKASAGASESIPLISVTNLARAMAELKEAGVWIAGAAGEADKTLYELDLKGPIAWALGAEGEGLRRLTRERCDWLARIPMAGQVESLNVSVATGICLFETQRQRG